MILVRLVEAGAIGGLIASLGAILLLAVSLWRGGPVSLACTELIILTGVAGGLLWGFLRRPGPLAAALEADRQLNLCELLSSAWWTQRDQSCLESPWSASLLAEAEVVSRGLSLSRLKLRRLGGRTWGAVTLAMALVMTLAALAPAPTAAVSAGRNGETVADGRSSRPQRPAEGSDLFLSSENRPIILSDPDDPNSSRFGQDAVAKSTAATQPGGEGSDDDPHADARPGEAGVGGGAARTNAPDSSPALTAHPSNSAPGPRGDPSAERASGAGVASGLTHEGSAPAGGKNSAAGAVPLPPQPPWTGGGWEADIRQAHAALENGRIPAGYRDLVRGYFSE